MRIIDRPPVKNGVYQLKYCKALVIIDEHTIILRSYQTPMLELDLLNEPFIRILSNISTNTTLYHIRLFCKLFFPHNAKHVYYRIRELQKKNTKNYFYISEVSK